MLVSVSVLTFSSLVYFAEKDDQNWTFVEAFWWGLLTITTVGYGKQAWNNKPELIWNRALSLSVHNFYEIMHRKSTAEKF